MFVDKNDRSFFQRAVRFRRDHFKFSYSACTKKTDSFKISHLTQTIERQYFDNEYQFLSDISVRVANILPIVFVAEVSLCWPVTVTIKAYVIFLRGRISNNV